MQPATHPNYRRALILGLSLGCLTTLPTAVSGQSIREREAVRRQGLVAEADNLLMEGRKAFQRKDYEEAVQKYRQALDSLPKGAATADRQQAIVEHLTDGSVALAQQYRREGRYDQARSLLENVLVADPTNAGAQTQLDYLDDPIRTNPSLTYEHTKDVDKVRRLLYEGEGFYNLGKFDEAHRKFDAVLRIDPYNTAARRWQERVNSTRSDYYRAAYDETRSRLLMQVDRAWELAVPPEPGAGQPDFGDGGEAPTGPTYIKNKLRSVIIPSVDFEAITVEEAIDFLRQRSRELDTTTLNPDDKGINFVIRKARTDGAGGVDAELDAEAGLGAVDPGGAVIPELKLRNVPLLTVLEYICDQAKLRYKVDEFAVTLLPLSGAGGEDFVTRTWVVPPTFVDDIAGGGGGGGVEDNDPFAEDGGGASAIAARPPLRELLENNGIAFPDGTSASYLPGPSTLVVRNTSANLDLVDALVARVRDTIPKMINIQTRFVEVSQENTDELSFDWVISPFGLIGGQRLFAGGGTIGSGTNRTGADFGQFPLGPDLSPAIPQGPGQPFVPAVPGVPLVTGIPSGTVDSVRNIATGGLRSGQSAISSDSIDAILNNPDRLAQVDTVAPGILSLTGLFGAGEFQMIMRGLGQKRGVDIMTAPSVVARPGQKATIEIIREFIYPTEYEPPELPNNVGTGIVGGAGGAGGAGIFPVTPATPTAFDTEPTGVTLEIEPNVGTNDFVIELRLAPQIVEFEGFINYGSPITSPSTNALGNPVRVTITENRIEMPVFATRRVTTGIVIYDGHTVAIGGMIREDVQKVEDKVPVLGDIPFLGRLFQSNAENRIKSNLIVFVTAQIIDATGQPLRGGPSLTSTDSSSTPGVLPPR